MLIKLNMKTELITGCCGNINIQHFCFNAKVQIGVLKSLCLQCSKFCGRLCCIMNELVFLYEQLESMNGVNAALNCI